VVRLPAKPAKPRIQGKQIVFPVLGRTQLTISFGDPRGQGVHEGEDIMAPRKAPAIAAEAGRVRFHAGSARAGCMLYLDGDSGTKYLYVHLNNDLTMTNDNRGTCVQGVAFARGLKDGQRVLAGQPVGFVGESATPTMVTAGIDTMTSGGVLMGLAVSAGTKKPSFSLGGSYTQDEFAVSAYTAASLGPIWFNMIGSFGALHYDVNRVVPLGITLQQNKATTNGTNASLAGRFGHNTVTGPITHGPVVGFTLQSVQVDGFTETGGGVTSLAFADQARHSAVGVLGYQATLDAGMFRPFARVLWNHEFASNNRQVTASLTSTVAPSYSLPAVELGKDWASASAGVAVTLGTGVTGLVSFTGQLGQDKVTTYGGQVGLNVAF